MKFSSSLIVVKDTRKSKSFYENALGQEVEADFGENVGFKGGFALMQRALWEKILCAAGNPAEATRSGIDHELYFEDDDPEAAMPRLLAAGATILHPVIEQPWRQKVARFRDPDGHIVEIGETMPGLCLRLLAEGLDAEGISKATSMPVDMVKRFLG